MVGIVLILLLLAYVFRHQIGDIIGILIFLLFIVAVLTAL